MEQKQFEVGSPESIREMELVVEYTEKIIAHMEFLIKGIDEGKIKILA